MIENILESRINRLLLTEENAYLAVLNQFYKKKYNKEYPEPKASDDELQKAVVDVASEMGFDPKGSDLRAKANNAKQYIPKNLDKVKPETQPSGKPESKEEDEKPNDISPKKFPKYKEFRKKWYAKTVELGWPKSIKNPNLKDAETEGGIEYPWSKLTNSAFPFNAKGPGATGFRNYTKKIKDYLYSKFKNDYVGLEKLGKYVDSVIQVEKNFISKKPSSIIGHFMVNVFKGLGATEMDENILKWMTSKANGMTIFEYQKYILDEMLAKIALGDESPKVLKNILNPLYKNVKSVASKFYDISVAKPEVSYDPDDRKVYGAVFKVTVKTGNKDPKTNKVYSPFVTICNTIVRELLGGKYNSASNRKLTSNINEDRLNEIIDMFEKSVDNEEDIPKGSKLKLSSDVAREVEDIKFSYDAIEKDEVIGEYRIEFSYLTKGCKISVGYTPKRGN